MRERPEVLVVSCYESGHQPLAAASALAALDAAGLRAAGIDLAVEPLETLDDTALRDVRMVAVSVPMHTALHTGMRAAAAVRSRAPGAHICFYGLYATLNATFLLERAVDTVIGGEFERPLTELATAIVEGRETDRIEGVGRPGRLAAAVLEKQTPHTPRRAGLPAHERYAKLRIDDEERIAAAVEASRGCLHSCRHCPIPPVYAGRFFVVPRDKVLDDVRQLVASGVRHITFADPDFFNGPGHSMAIVQAMHDEFPGLTFDATTKIERVLRHRSKLDELARCGCVFLVSAVESLNDEVLGHLAKGHTRRDVFEALELLRAAGIALRPSFVAFTPWTRIEDYLDLLDWIDAEGLVGHVDPVQLAIRLLVPPGSLLGSHPAMLPHLRDLIPERFVHEWVHPDPSMDALHANVGAIVRDAVRNAEVAAATYRKIRRAALAAGDLGSTMPEPAFLPARATSDPPRLTEPWFC